MISDAMASTVTKYGGNVHYGPIPVGLVGTGRCGIFDGRSNKRMAGFSHDSTGRGTIAVPNLRASMSPQ